MADDMNRDPRDARDAGKGPHTNDIIHHDNHPGVGDHVGEAAYVLAQLVGRVGLGLQVLRGAPEEVGERGRAHPVGAVGLLERLEQGEPLGGGGGLEDRRAGVELGR